MIIIPPPLEYPRRRAPKKGAPPAPPPVVGLTLVSATYNPDFGPTLRLTFDRAINIASLHGAAIVVDDGANLGEKFNATGVKTLIGPTTVEVFLIQIDVAESSEVLLTATGGSGIVAVNNGGTWAGATNLGLPFP